MTTIRSCLAGAVLLLAIAPNTIARPKVVAYVPNWIDVKAFVERIDYAKLTHINVAFANPTNDAGDLSFNDANALLIAKAREHGVKVLISVGGGGAAENERMRERYADLLTDGNRAGFVAKLAEYVSRHGFDGLDVDLEGPAINADYGPFIRDLSAALKRDGKLLTAAVSQGYGGRSIPDSVFEHFDFVNIMAYDATGPWNPKAPGQHSSIEFAKRNVAHWLERGLPRSKAVLGVPFYGHAFGEAAAKRRGYAYSAIVKEFPGAEHRDQAGNTIWYNGIPTIKAKAQYVIDEGLAGVMIWSLDQDAEGERSLLAAIHQTLTAPPAEPQR